MRMSTLKSRLEDTDGFRLSNGIRKTIAFNGIDLWSFQVFLLHSYESIWKSAPEVWKHLIVVHIFWHRYCSFCTFRVVMTFFLNWNITIYCCIVLSHTSNHSWTLNNLFFQVLLKKQETDTAKMEHVTYMPKEAKKDKERLTILKFVLFVFNFLVFVCNTLLLTI